MAHNSNNNNNNNKVTYPYPSQFGSHSSMIDQEATVKLDDLKLVACRDAYGVYVTERNRLDNGLSDNNRANGRRMHGVETNKD